MNTLWYFPYARKSTDHTSRRKIKCEMPVVELVPSRPGNDHRGFFLRWPLDMIANMLKRNTVLILGAGASKDFGFPLGLGLLLKIRDECRRVAKGRYEHIANAGFSINKYAEFADMIDNSHFQTVDELLAKYPEHSEIGRFLIAVCLLPIEKAGAFDLESRSKNWILYLMNKMEQNASTLEDFVNNNPLTFITFNYDRSLEYSLHHRLLSTFPREDSTRITLLLKRFSVIHVHGKLGDLTQVKYGEGEDHFKLGAGVAMTAASSIRIIHEADETSPDFTKACKAIEVAECVGILGFGYHTTNMARLRFKALLKDKVVYGTSMGMSGPEIGAVKALIQRNLAFFQPVDCLTLLKETELLF